MKFSNPPEIKSNTQRFISYPNLSNLPRAISRSDSASANLSVNLSRVLRVRSLADVEAPSSAARMARISSANEEAFEGLLTC